MSIQLLVIVAAVVAACSLHLGVGFWIGSHVVRGKYGALLTDSYESVCRAHAILDGAASQANLLLTQARHVAGCGQVKSSPRVLKLVQDMASLSESCSVRLRSAQAILQEHIVGACKFSDRIIARNDPHACLGIYQRGFDESSQAVALPANLRTNLQRHAYEALEFAAPLVAAPPAPDRFEPVSCRELSTEGVTFFSRERPQHDSLVITLGTQANREFFVAHVESISRLPANDPDGYFIYCRFTKRLKEVYRWNADEGTIVFQTTQQLA